MCPRRKLQRLRGPRAVIRGRDVGDDRHGDDGDRDRRGEQGPRGSSLPGALRQLGRGRLAPRFIPDDRPERRARLGRLDRRDGRPFWWNGDGTLRRLDAAREVAMGVMDRVGPGLPGRPRCARGTAAVEQADNCRLLAGFVPGPSQGRIDPSSVTHMLFRTITSLLIVMNLVMGRAS